MASTNIQTFPGKVGVSNTNPIHTLDIGSNVYIDDTADTKLRIVGNIHASGITVDGTITTIETENLSVKDPIILLASESTGTSDTGIIMKRADGDSNVAIFYDEGVGLKIGHTLSTAEDIHLTVDTGTQLSTSIYGPVTVADSSTQALTVDGGAYVTTDFKVGASKLFVDVSESSVGIGTDAPAYTLDVHGTANVGTLTATSISSSSDLEVGTANLFVDTTTSNVGIGTATPAYELDVVGNVHADYFIGDGSGITNITSANVNDFGSNVSRIETLETDLGSNVTRIETLETDLGSNVTRIETLETDLASNVTRIETLETDLSDNVTRIETLETDLGSNVTRIETLETDLGSNVTRIETLETDLGSNVTRIETLESGDMTIDGEKTFSSNLEVGTAKFFVDTTTGNVGIGTDSPSGFDVYNKEINQTFRNDFTNIHRNNKCYIDSRDDAAPNALTQRYAVSSAGNNGLNSRNSELVLGVASDQNSPLPGSSFISFSDDKRLYLGSHPWEDFMSDWRATSNQAYPRMGSNTFAPHMTLIPSGNVGIGTTNPGALLELSSDTGSSTIVPTKMRISSTSSASDWSTTDDWGMVSFYSTDGSGAGPADVVSIGARAVGTVGGTAALTFRTKSGDAFPLAERMCILDDGKVGIGKTNPFCKLHIAADNGSATGSNKRVRFSSGSGTSLTVDTGASSGVSFWCDDWVGSGVGFIATNATTFSDERLKKNIIDADDGECLDTLRQLKPKKYQYKDYIKRGETPVWGFIAQEVEQILPYSTHRFKEFIPNIYELANVSASNVITFTNFNTSNLEANATTIQVITKDDSEERATIAEVIDEHTIRVEEDLSEWTGSVDETGNVVAGNQLFIYGQQLEDVRGLKKDAIWTVATSALQEVDRQLQAEKAKVAALETQLTSVLARLDALESA